MKFYLSLIFAFVVFCSSAYSDSLIETLDDEIYYGKIIEEDEEKIKIINNEDIAIEIPKSNINYITPLLYEVTTISGNTYIGSIVSENKDGMIMQTKAGIQVEIPRDKMEVKMIAQEHIEIINPHVYNANYAPLYKPTYISPDFGMLGLNVGTPGFLNIYLAYQTEVLGLALNGGPTGIEFNLGVRLSTTKYSIFNANAVLAYSTLLEDHYEYSGLKFTYTYKAIFTEFGLGVKHTHIEFFFIGAVGAFIEL